MQKAFFTWLAAFVCLSSVATAGTRPPNDDFADRILLEGNSIRFSGTLAGATVEDPLESYGPDPTVWWTWTATETSPVIIQVWDIQRSSPAFTRNDWTTLSVYSLSNLTSGFPAYHWSFHRISYNGFLPDSVHPTLCFTGYAGRTYQFQLAGRTAANYEFSLTATNNPIILAQPQSRTAREHAAVLLTVTAVGQWPLGYQWQKGGVSLPGAQSPTLVFRDVELTNAGDYSVIVSNATGVSTSQVAHLFVTPTPFQPLLQTVGMSATDGLGLRLNGETGALYRILSSTNLLHWVPETAFVSKHLLDSKPVTNNFVFASNGVASFQVPAVGGTKLVRAVYYAPSNEVCNVNLKQFRFLKNIWAIEKQATSTDTPMESDVFPPYKVQKPVCPEGGYYMFGPVGTAPQCSLPRHVLQEPQ